MSKDDDWCSLIRQKINNLYTRYFDSDVILNNDYMNLLKTPKNLYYQWIDGIEMDADELTNIIDEAIHKAIELAGIYGKQKMELTWNEYKCVIEQFLRRAFDNCKTAEEYENKTQLISIYDFSNEDNFYVSYICKSLEGEMLKWQKKYYGVRDHKNYKRCKECGSMIEISGRNTQYCNDCKNEKRKETKRNWWNKNH